MPKQKIQAEDKNPILDEFTRFKKKELNEESFKQQVEIYLLSEKSVIERALDNGNFYGWALAQGQKIEGLDDLVIKKGLENKAQIIAKTNEKLTAGLIPVTKARVKTFLEDHKIQYTGDNLNFKHQIKNDFLTQINTIRKTKGAAFNLDEMVKMGCDNLKARYPDINPKIYKKELLSGTWSHRMRSLIDTIDKDWKNKEAPEQKEPTRKGPR